MTTGARKRGRPPKFGRPTQMVALTLPESVVRELRAVNDDLAWAIVTMVENGPLDGHRLPDAELISIGDGRWLIAVNRSVLKRIPGVHFVPMNGARALLALSPGSSLSDLEVAVVDRLRHARLGDRERGALTHLASQLRAWRRSRSLRFYARTIIEAERVGPRAPHGRAARSGTTAASGRRSPRTRR